MLIKKLKNYWQNAKLLRKISDMLFIIAISISLYTLISTKLAQSALPPGVCPIDNKSELYYLSIFLLITAFILSLFDKKK